MKRFFAVILAVLFCTVSFAAAGAKGAVEPKLGVGMSVMGFSSYDVVTGAEYTSDVLDDVVCTVINEWADWCGPCMSEMPHFQAMHEYYSGTPEADVQILGSVYCSNGGTTPASAAQLCTNNGYTWPNLVEDNVLAQVFNTSNSIPQTIIVDRHGVVRDHVVGSFPTSAQLQSFIDGWYQALLEEEGPIDPSEPEPLAGDYDGDNQITINDALGILRIYMGLIEAPEGFMGDVNGDGVVDLNDALYVLRVAMGLIEG